jgi:Flp pilus assembly protein TadG
MKTGRSHESMRRGAVAVEAAVVTGSLLILMFAIFEYGRYVMIRHVVDNAAREGARLAVSANTWDVNSFNYQTTQTIQDAVRAAMGGQDAAMSPPNIQVYLADSQGNNIGTWTNAKVDQNIGVEIGATYTSMLPTLGFLPGSIPVFAKAVMRSETN